MTEGMIYYNRKCYELNEYRKIRQHNREVSSGDKENYCSKQVNFEHSYFISVDGVVYVMNSWLDGLRELSKHYGVKLYAYPSFSLLFSHGKSLPANIDFAIENKEGSKENLRVHSKYISHEHCFMCDITENKMRYTIYYGDVDKIKSGKISLFL